MSLPDDLTPELWLAQVFASGPAGKRGGIKRQVRDVERLDGRGLQAVENGGHVVVFCNRLPIRRVQT